MHRQEFIHRDIKLENIVLCHVEFGLHRGWPKFVISAGQSIVQSSSEAHCAALLSTSPQKYSWVSNTIKK